MDKPTALEILQKQWSNCDRCQLCETRKNVVFGEGNPDAHIMIIGEAPGEMEDSTGRPFRGEAGQILNRFLRVTKLSREKDLYVTNIVGCRPTMDVEDERTKEMRKENRPPSKEERMGCKERLNKLIYIVDPMMIVVLGKTALQALTGKSTVITKARGDIQTMRIQGHTVEIRYPVMPMFHPAFLARSYNFDPSGPWGQTSQDFGYLCKIVDYLREKYYGIKPPKRGEDNGNKESEQSGEDD
jgi:uracil-DNA glycosylase